MPGYERGRRGLGQPLLLAELFHDVVLGAVGGEGGERWVKRDNADELAAVVEREGAAVGIASVDLNDGGLSLRVGDREVEGVAAADRRAGLHVPVLYLRLGPLLVRCPVSSETQLQKLERNKDSEGVERIPRSAILRHLDLHFDVGAAIALQTIRVALLLVVIVVPLHPPLQLRPRRNGSHRRS